jgi:hypothetical protein
MKVEESLGEGKPAIAPTRQGKKNSIEPHASYPKPIIMHPPRKLHSQRFVPTSSLWKKWVTFDPTVLI